MWVRNISATGRGEEYIEWGKGFHPDFKSSLNPLKFLPDVHKWFLFLLLFKLVLKSKMAADDIVANSKLRLFLLFWKKELVYELVLGLSPHRFWV